MRRTECEKKDPRVIADILEGTNIGTLTTIDGTGAPVTTPVNYGLRDGRICFHSSPYGEKMENLNRDDRVCFCVMEPLSYIDVGFLQNPCKLHQFFRSVVIRGRAQVLTDPEEKVAALNAIVKAHEPDGAPPVTAAMPAVAKCSVVEILPDQVTAKVDLGEEKAPEFRERLARYLKERGRPADLATVTAMGFDPEDL